MLSETRFRKPADHARALSFSLEAAELNQCILSQSASDPELSVLVKGPMSHAIRSAVVHALHAAASHVEELATVSTWEADARPTDADIEKRAEAIRVLGRQLHQLAAEGMTRSIQHGEFEAIRVRLMDLGFALKPEHVLDVASATLVRET